MQQQNSGMSCQLGSWAMAAGVGLLTFVVLLVVGSTGWIGSIFLGGVAFVVLGLVFGRLFCKELPPARGPGNIDAPSRSAATAGTAPTASTAKASTAAASTGKTATADSKTSAPERDSPNANVTKDNPSSDALPDVQTANATADSEAGAQVKPSQSLAGQSELASRKGAWKYEGEKPEAKKAEPAKKKAAAKPAAKANSDSDDGGDGTKPATLDAPRDGSADNLKEIKGVGPKLEQTLHSMGFYHFDQIANWSADEIVWVDANLEGFKGRVTRDNWVEQAKILASGGDTEFSKRVDKGDVY